MDNKEIEKSFSGSKTIQFLLLHRTIGHLVLSLFLHFQHLVSLPWSFIREKVFVFFCIIGWKRWRLRESHPWKQLVVPLHSLFGNPEFQCKLVAEFFMFLWKWNFLKKRRILKTSWTAQANMRTVIIKEWFVAVWLSTNSNCRFYWCSK